MTKQTNIILGILGVVIVGLVIWQVGSFRDEDGFMKVRMYDAEGNIIGTASSLSVVQGFPGVSFIDFTITAINTGEIPLTCSIVSSTPTAFDLALDKSSKIVPSASPSKASWTSGLVSVEQFEGITQPVRFEVTMRCNYRQGVNTINLDDKVGYIDLTITADTINAGFDVDVETGGTGTEFCGDAICQIDEDAISCPADCAVANFVMFRTTDLSYTTGSAIAYSESCGAILDRAFGTISGGAASVTNCDTYFDTVIFESIPCTASDGCKLGIRDGELRVCMDMGSSINFRRYGPEGDSSGIDTTQVAFDNDKEVAC